jgi:hypothetical protein
VRFEHAGGEQGAHLYAANYAANIVPQKGRIVDRRRGQAQGFLTTEEIRNIAARLPDANRPPWLDLVYAPATIPRRSRISAARFTAGAAARCSDGSTISRAWSALSALVCHG